MPGGSPSSLAAFLPPTVTVPSAPSFPSASAGNSSVTLSWSPPPFNGNSAVLGYNVYESTSAGGEGSTPVNTSQLPATASSFVVTGLSNGTKYYFTIKAVNGIGSSVASTEVNARPAVNAGAPGAPTNLARSPGPAL